MFCFRQFEDWVYQPPLNLLMFKFLTGKHSKALQGSWNLRSLLTRDTGSWAEGSQMWLQPGSQSRENQSRRVPWWSLSALPLPRSPSLPGHLLCLCGDRAGQPRGISPLRHGLYISAGRSPTSGAALTAFLWLCGSQLKERPAWR